MIEKDDNQAQIRFGTVAVCDTNGLLRGQKLSSSNFESAVKKGAMGMAPVTLAVDPTDEILILPGVTDENADFHDCPLEVDPSTRRQIPWEDERDNSLYLAQFTGDIAAMCPRSLLQKVLGKARERGFEPKYGLELEFTLFNETSDSLWQKDFQNLTTATKHASHDLLIYQAAQSDFYGQLADMCEPLKINLAKIHEEIGGGFMEACIEAGTGLEPADQLVLLKNFLRVLAMRREQTVTFMPRWSDEADGQSIHVHISLADKDGKSVFWSDNGDNNMSNEFRHFIGGLQKYLGDMMLIFAPTVNAYRRFHEGTFAPPMLSWGIDNRTSCFRVVGDNQRSFRFENRLPGGDSNPYLSVAATLAAGLKGMEEKTEPTEPTVANGYVPGQAFGPDFPKTMPEAIKQLSQSVVANEYLGKRFVEAFTSTRQSQLDAFEGKTLTDEMKRFFELG